MVILKIVLQKPGPRCSNAPSYTEEQEVIVDVTSDQLEYLLQQGFFITDTRAQILQTLTFGGGAVSH